MNVIHSLEELYITLKDEEDLDVLKNVIDTQEYDFDFVKADLNGNEEIKKEIPQKLYSKVKALLNKPILDLDVGPLKYWSVEYETMIASAIHRVCEQIYKIVVPDAILKFISELCSLCIETQILKWDDIQWIYNNVIPINRYMTDRLYNVSPIIDDKDKNSFKQYDSYKFHDCVDEKGATVFIIDCGSMVIGGYCDKSWFSPHKRRLQSRGGNAGWFVEGSVASKLFVLRNEALTKKLDISLPLLATNLTKDKNIMVAANADGPNFGYNHFYITSGGHIATKNDSRYFDSPIADIKFGQFMTYNGNESEHEHEQKRRYYHRQSTPKVSSLEVFAVQPIKD